MQKVVAIVLIQIFLALTGHQAKTMSYERGYEKQIIFSQFHRQPFKSYEQSYVSSHQEPIKRRVADDTYRLPEPVNKQYRKTYVTAFRPEYFSPAPKHRFREYTYDDQNGGKAIHYSLQGPHDTMHVKETVLNLDRRIGSAEAEAMMKGIMGSMRRREGFDGNGDFRQDEFDDFVQELGLHF